MIRTIRAYFLSRLLREKILLLVFILVGVLIWSSSFASQAGAFWRAQRATTAALEEQDSWVKRRDQIEASTQKAAAQLDRSQTLNGIQLYSEVDRIARETGVKTSNFSPMPIVTNGQFTFNALKVTVSGEGNEKGWLALETFYIQLRDRAPYIGISEFNLATRGNPPQQQHIVQLTVVSPEIASK